MLTVEEGGRKHIQQNKTKHLSCTVSSATARAPAWAEAHPLKANASNPQTPGDPEAPECRGAGDGRAGGTSARVQP